MEKITIKYDYKDSCYLATTKYRGEYYTGASIDSFEKAKEKLLKKIEEFKEVIIPEPEDEWIEEVKPREWWIVIENDGDVLMGSNKPIISSNPNDIIKVREVIE